MIYQLPTTSNRSSAASRTGVSGLSRRRTFRFVCSTSTCQTTMSRTTPHHSPMFYPRTSCAPSSLPRTCEHKSRASCTDPRHQTTSRSRRSRSVSVSRGLQPCLTLVRRPSHGFLNAVATTVSSCRRSCRPMTSCSRTWSLLVGSRRKLSSLLIFRPPM